ncbi:hypothetical protein ACTMTI_05550 [Nonomuraea sp. H19]|uniref:hypothetical protein n=1 Tax=Nonomuraea sp. H19 TaxID=3452206 RepID=UPI003F8A33A4
MRKTIASVLSSAAVVLGMLAVTTAPAAAATANPTKRCQAEPGEIFPICNLYFYNFPGGTISIDVDADGTGTGHWNLQHHGRWTDCNLYYNLQDPAQSWTCSNLPAGNYILRNAGQTNTTFHQLGARW